jgi:hypothetical protein
VSVLKDAYFACAIFGINKPLPKTTMQPEAQLALKPGIGQATHCVKPAAAPKVMNAVHHRLKTAKFEE